MTTNRLVIPDLAGKAVLITGASTGIGAAVARGFADQGASVAIGYNSSAEKAQALASEIKAAGGEALAVKGDVAEPNACERLVAETTARFGRLDGLVNNAGLMLGRVHSLEASDQHVQAVIDLNGRSVVSMTRAAAPWLERQGGFIINTTSIAARNGGAGGAILYAAAKGFVSTLTRGHAKELIGKKIRVNAVSPGVIATPFHERYSDAATLEAIRKTIPIARLGTAEDCVGAYLFLASEALSAYVVGQIIEVNGGQLMP
ncbi:MAG TPA: SDR family oxidoreductase [Roseiarcus sp.]|nr:SDR family oxidoreductase [Roseiarcus sp.]